MKIEAERKGNESGTEEGGKEMRSRRTYREFCIASDALDGEAEGSKCAIIGCIKRARPVMRIYARFLSARWRQRGGGERTNSLVNYRDNALVRKAITRRGIMLLP